MSRRRARATVRLLVDYHPHRSLVVGPDGTWTLAGMVDGDPATATEFYGELYGHTDVGVIVLSST